MFKILYPGLRAPLIQKKTTLWEKEQLLSFAGLFLCGTLQKMQKILLFEGTGFEYNTSILPAI